MKTKKIDSNKNQSNKKKINKGFTLIELLAVIIILGILMIIAIPSVTSYISESRKNAYINTAKEIIGGARTLVNEGKLEMFDVNSTYYIPTKCINTENGSKSPYGEFKEAYVGVIYTGEGYNYYWISVDTSEQGIKEVTREYDLDTDLIESNINFLDIKETVDSTGMEGRKNILQMNEDCSGWDNPLTATNLPGLIVYPPRKDHDTVTTGEIVKIGDEDFYVLKNDVSNGNLILLAKYNLKVGSIYSGSTLIRNYDISDEGYGRQSSEARGYDNSGYRYGTIRFSNSEYWKENLGTVYPGGYCDGTIDTNCAYVYDSNCNAYRYIEEYRQYLEGLGAEIKEARLMRVEEALELGCSMTVDNGSCNKYPANAPAFLYETSYWLGSVRGVSTGVWRMSVGGDFGRHYNYKTDFGVRPVIVI